MNTEKEAALAHISALKAEISKYEAIVNAQEKSKEQEMSDFLDRITKEMVLKREDGCINFYTKDDKFLFRQDFKNGILFVSYSVIWSVFESRFGLEYAGIQSFIGVWCEGNLNWKGLTPDQDVVPHPI